MTHARVLAGRLADLLCREQDALAEFLIALADFDRRAFGDEWMNQFPGRAAQDASAQPGADSS